jgi:glycosyltransferase involved in cell wall biosynthesis
LWFSKILSSILAMRPTAKRQSHLPPAVFFRPDLGWVLLSYIGAAIAVALFSLFRYRPAQFKPTVLPQLALPVTIMIPSYQRERYLKRAIASALNQTLNDIEVLIVDDHSSDRSAAIVESLMAREPRIRMIRHAANSGTHVARITGVLQARGHYLLSLDADDELYPFIAEDALHFALLNKVDLVEFHVVEVLGGRATQFSYCNPPVVSGDKEKLMTLFRTQNLNWNIWKRLIRREVYMKAINLLTPKVRGKRIIYAEDKLHFGLVCLIANGFYFLKEPGYVYYKDNPENSESGTQQSRATCLRQLRYVERALRYFYRVHANVVYQIWGSNPKGLESQ